MFKKLKKKIASVEKKQPKSIDLKNQIDTKGSVEEISDELHTDKLDISAKGIVIR